MTNAVLVVDMLKGFLEEGCPLYCGKKACDIIPNVKALLQEESKKGSKIFFICDSHAPDDAEFKMFPPHCIQGTKECEVIPELSGFGGEIIPKNRYSAFFGTELESKLKKLKPEKLVVCGVCTDICVLHSVADARNREYPVEIPVDCVASFDEKAHKSALTHMEKILGAKLTHTEGIAKEVSPFEPSDSVLSGDTADVYFQRTVEILKKENMNPVVTAEVFGSRGGVLCGMKEVLTLLSRVLPSGKSEVWALEEGALISHKDVVMRIKAPYQSFGLYETALIGILANCTGWASAARDCVEAARGVPITSFGARHVHPQVAGLMDYSAVIGGCNSCSSILGAKLPGVKPAGTMPHALILIMGDTVKATIAFDKWMPSDVPRVSLVDTFKDEAEESLRVAAALGDKLSSVRLDTPEERGRVTNDLVKEVRARLDLAGFKHVKIFVSGGVNPERIRNFLDSGAPVDGFGVGSYISGARPNDFKLEIKEVDGKPIAKRGRIPGLIPSPRLRRVM